MSNEQQQGNTITDADIASVISSLGSHFRTLRLERKFSLTYVSSAVGMTKARLSLIENGKVNKDVRFASFIRLARFYGEESLSV